MHYLHSDKNVMTCVLTKTKPRQFIEGTQQALSPWDPEDVDYEFRTFILQLWLIRQQKGQHTDYQ